MNISLRLSLTALTLCFLAACGNNSNQATTTDATLKSSQVSANPPVVTSVNAYTPLAVQPDTAVQLVKHTETAKSQSAKQAVRIELKAPTTQELAPLSKQANKNEQGVAKLQQIGFSRTIDQTGNAKNTGTLLKWQSLSNGNSLAVIQIQSVGAKGIRMGLMVNALPANALLRVHNGQGGEAFQIQASHVLKLIQSNIAADGDNSNAHIYWTPMTFGAASLLEIELPVGSDVSAVDVSIPTISHAVQTPLDPTLNGTDQTKVAGACNVDAMCTLPPAMNAIARTIFQLNGSTYVCSGTLLGDSVASNTPYFLTAYHCISSQTVASSVQTYWFWRSNACNSTTINPSWEGRYSGASYLWGRYGVSAGTATAYTPDGTDTSFLKLLDTPPAGAMFAGWNVNPQVASTTINYIGLHHPTGDLLKRSDGKIVSYSISLADGDYTSTTISTLPRYRVGWTSGITEGGSSGSPLFLNGASTNPQVVGQLYGGSSSCTNPTGTDSYGRFDIAYQIGLSDWLNPIGNKRVARFYNQNSGTHFYTISASEGTYLKTNFPSTFSYEGTPFSASVTAGAGLSPVHRFYNLSLGVHFYTISEAERAWVVANLPQMRYEGVAWYANPTVTTGTIPLFRFYNRDKGVHFYTVSAAERDSVIANLPQMNYEGIAYYVLP